MTYISPEAIEREKADAGLLPDQDLVAIRRIQARETIKRRLPDPYDPASYRHICNERNAQGAARMARLIAPYLERKVK